MGEYFESFPEEITKWEIIRGMVDLHLDDAQPVQNKKIPSVQLLPRQDVMRYGWIPKMEQVIYTKCRECKLVFKPWDILSHKSCSGRSIPTIPHSSKKKVHNKGNLKIPSSTLRKQAVKESASPSISNPAASVPVSTPSPAVASNSAANSASTPAKAVTKMVVDDITSSQPIKTTTTATAATVSKSQLAVSTSGSSKPHVAHSQKSHHTSWPSRTETGGSNSGSSSSHSHHHGHGHSHHHHHSSGSSHSNHGRTSSSSSSSSRYKKSKKSNSSCRVAVKHFDPDVHCGVVVSGKGPCTRSVTCSNHRVRKTPFRRVRLKYMLRAVCIV
ncbi:unnamed protein product [Acanthoscelides obtectus]|uniref:SCA7 domain-containing protein n=1 Tax=Acanthoscelides obtectus TaxID=200917 RepID=A0A9P0PIZ7_ACAOB|nr:unnamed protein product [Acanthoscelides obtectus]CAK1628496.1 hypothetical protein AOBTE_LOCUS5246 [Acanthoscelides obtectus]